MMYLHTIFHLCGPSRLGCEFYTTMGLAAILDQKWRLFQNVGFFPLPTHGPTPSYEICCF